jgi:transposase
MNPSPTNPIIKNIGMDVHAVSNALSIASSDGEVRDYGIIGGKPSDLDPVINKLKGPNVVLRFVYEAGPTGFGLCRYLRAKGYVCEVVCPSLIPRKASDRIKTDRRDARDLARLFRAGELTFIHVPDPTDESIRDWMRLRESAVRDQRQARQRLKGFLLRQGHRYTGKTTWGPAHLNYLSVIKFPLPAHQQVLEEHIQHVQALTLRLERLTKTLPNLLPGWRWEPLVRALMTFRGISLINSLTLVSEIGDFTRFDNAPGLMKFMGLVSSEHSTGQKRSQGPITKAGNCHCRRALVEAAWHYRLPARVSPTLRQRQHGQPQAVVELSWKTQQRLCARFRHLQRQNKQSVVTVTAVARELVGFIWAAAKLMAGQPVPSRPPKSSTPSPKASKKKTYVLEPAKCFNAKPVQPTI